MSRFGRLAALSLAFAVAASGLSGCGGAQARAARHLEKGREYLAADDLQKARIEFLNVLQLSPKDTEAHVDLGIVDEKLGHIREAAQYYQAAIDLKPDDPTARARLARVYLLAG